MAKAAIGSHLSVYLPKWVATHLREGREPSDVPFVEDAHGAVLFLDIAGFTERTDKLAQRGGRGSEELSNLLEDCFAPLTDIVSQHGGDIIAFAGDGFVALWQNHDISFATHLAVQCALAVQRATDKWPWRGENYLRQRISIDCGKVYRCKVGGYDGRWHFLVVGDPIQQVGAAYRKAQVGQVVLCDAARRTLAGSCEVERRDDVYILNRLTQLPLELPVVAQDTRVPGVEYFVPRVVLDRASFSDRKWLGDFRNVSVLDINLLDIRFDDTLLSSLQNRVFEIQRICVRLEGTIHHLLMDDKGVTIALAFGMPPLAHEEDPLRAIEAALAIREAFRKMHFRTSMGVATGRLFCRDYGGQSRREYCLIGQALNYAARLMEMADGEVLCDAATAQALSGRVTFSVLPAVHVHGRLEPLAAFRPMKVVTERRTIGATEIVGRHHERAMLRQLLDPDHHRQHNFVLVTGEAGIGKSRLLTDLMQTAENCGHQILQGFARAIDKSTLYFAWRNVLGQLLDLQSDGDAAHARAKLRDKLSGEPVLLRWSPLLSDVLPLGLPETEFTKQIAGAARAASIEELVIYLLGVSAQYPCLLIFEDLHWFDGASIALLAAVTRRLPKLIIVASTRSDLHSASILAAEHIPTLEIHLNVLPREAIAEIVCRVLRVSNVPSALVDFVLHRTGGNPFYSEELVLALRDTGGISVSRGTCQISHDLSHSAEMAFTASLESAIVSRIDALPVEDQLVLKVASAVGDIFSAEILQSVHPESRGVEEIETILESLRDLDVLRVYESHPKPRYVFRHAISQEATYNTLSFRQRKVLHGEIALSLERRNAGRLEPLYAQLAEHWERADDGSRAVSFLELAAEQALRNYSNREAIHYIKKAFQLTEQMTLNTDTQRSSAWEVILGDAYHELSDYGEASTHYARAMRLLRQRLPSSGTERLIGLLGHAARHLQFRLVRNRPETLPANARVSFQTAAHVYERLSEEYFFLNDSLALLHGTLASLNFAERAGSTAEIINGFNALALGLAMSGLVSPAHFYSRRALQLAVEHGRLPDLARAELVAGVLAYGLAKWDLVDRCVERAMELNKTLGDRTRWQAARTISIFVAILCGAVGRAENLLHDLDTTISSDSSSQIKAWILSLRVLIGTISGNTDSCELKELRALAAGKLALADQLLCLGVAASAYMQRQEMAPAFEAAERGLAVLRESKIIWGGYVYGAAGVADVLLARCALAAAAGRSVETRDLENARAACRLMSRVARTSPVCQPFALLIRGRMSLLLGRTIQARRAWHAAASVAERLQMPREWGLALYEIGRTMATSDPNRHSSLALAAEIFEKFGIGADLKMVQQALSG